MIIFYFAKKGFYGDIRASQIFDLPENGHFLGFFRKWATGRFQKFVLTPKGENSAKFTLGGGLSEKKNIAKLQTHDKSLSPVIKKRG